MVESYEYESELLVQRLSLAAARLEESPKFCYSVCLHMESYMAK